MKVQVNTLRRGRYCSTCIPLLSLHSTFQQELQYHCWALIHQCIAPPDIPTTWQKTVNDVPYADQVLRCLHCHSPRALAPYWIRSHCLLSAHSHWSGPLWGEKPTFCILGSPQRHFCGLHWEAPAPWSFTCASRTLTWLVLLQMDALNLCVSHGLSCLHLYLLTAYTGRLYLISVYMSRDKDNPCKCN